MPSYAGPRHSLLRRQQSIVATGGAKAIIQHTQAQSGVIPISATGTGNLLAVGVVMAPSGATVVSVAGLANTYAQVPGSRVLMTNSSYAVIEWWYAKNSVAGDTAVTIVAPSASGALGGLVIEISNCDLVSPIDVVNTTYNTGNVTTSNGAPVTTTNANDVVLSMCIGKGTPLIGVAAGDTLFTLLDIIAGYATGTSSYLPTSTGTYTPIWTQTNLNEMAFSTVAFK